MHKLRTATRRDLEQTLDPIQTLIQEARIRGNGKTATARVVDPAQVAMLQITWPSGADGEWGIDIDKMKSAIKPFDLDDDTLTWGVNGDKKGLIEGGGVKRKLGLVDTASLPDPKLPTLNHTVRVHTTKEKLLKAMKHTEYVSDCIAIWSRPDGSAAIVAEGENDDVVIEIGEHESIGDGEHGLEYQVSLYSHDYLRKVVKTIPNKTPVSITYGVDYPCNVEWGAGGAEMLFLLAPRTATEDEGPDAITPQVILDAKKATPEPEPEPEAPKENPFKRNIAENEAAKHVTAPEGDPPTPDDLGREENSIESNIDRIEEGPHPGDGDTVEPPEELAEQWVPVEPAGATPDLDPEELARNVAQLYVEDHDGKEGAENGVPWDDIIARGNERGFTETQMENAVNELIDRGVLYEPALGKIRVC